VEVDDVLEGVPMIFTCPAVYTVQKSSPEGLAILQTNKINKNSLLYHPSFLPTPLHSATPLHSMTPREQRPKVKERKDLEGREECLSSKTKEPYQL
jgi:hypothetical protein